MPSTKKLLQAAAGNAGGDSLYVEDVFSTYLYDGNGSTQIITNGIDLDGEGGLTWIKARDIGYSHQLFDTERGATKQLYSNTTNGETTAATSLTSFNSDGFSLGALNGVNNASQTFASWTFRKAEKFFDVVTYTGNGVNGRQLPHSLGSTPGMVVCKRTDTGQNWILQHKSLDLSGNKTMYLNNTDALAVANDYWNSTHASSTAITLSGDADINGSGGTYVAYVFASDAGGYGDDGDENIIKCGSYEGNDSDTTEININLGFEPQWLLIKNADLSRSWTIVDMMRGLTYGPSGSGTGTTDRSLSPNLSSDEDTTSNSTVVTRVDPTPTGFAIRGKSAICNEFGTHIYIAIRRPMKTPEAGTEVFAPVGATSTAPLWKSSFPVDAGLYRYIIGSGAGTFFGSRLTGTGRLESSSSAAEVTDGSFKWDYMNGWFDNSFDNTNFVGFNFKRATGFMDVVAYTGNGAVRTIPHNLGVAPELMLFKIRSTVSNWQVYASGMGATKSNRLNSDGTPVTATAYFNDTAPTDSVFTLGTASNVNWSGNTFISYHFATLAGVSKVGSYTGTGSDLNVDCGFSAGARFILIKRTDASGDWYTYDSFRGIVAGNDPYILMNTTAAQVTNTDYIDPLSSGFTVTSSAPAALNASGGTYIFLAIA